MSDSKKSGYVGVTYYKQCNKWRTYQIHKGHMFYIGLFDNPHVAAAAREAFGVEFPEYCTARTRRNVIDPRARVDFANLTRDEDASGYHVFETQPNETWTELPSYPGYEVSSQRRIRTSKYWGWVEVLPTGPMTWVLYRAGRLSPFTLTSNYIRTQA